MQGIYGEILMERQEWKAAVKDQVKMILKYKPEAVFVGNNTFAALPSGAHAAEKTHSSSDISREKWGADSGENPLWFVIKNRKYVTYFSGI